MSLKLNMNLKFIVCTLSFTHSSLYEIIYMFSNHMHNAGRYNLYHIPPITAAQPNSHSHSRQHKVHYELAIFSVEYNLHLHNYLSATVSYARSIMFIPPIHIKRHIYTHVWWECGARHMIMYDARIIESYIVIYTSWNLTKTFAHTNAYMVYNARDLPDFSLDRCLVGTYSLHDHLRLRI